MRLEFEYDYIACDLEEEISFKDYLEQFKESLPLIESKILRPLSYEEAKTHYDNLNTLYRKLQTKLPFLENLIRKICKLPALDHFFLTLKQKDLGEVDLFLFVQFISIHRGVVHLENEVGIIDSSSTLLFGDEFDKLVKNYFVEDHLGDFSGEMKLSSEEINLGEKLRVLESRIQSEITSYEDQIWKELKVKMVYPYPKEIIKSDLKATLLKRLKMCKLVTVKKGQDFYELDYIISKKIRDLEKKRDELSSKLNVLKTIQLKKITETIFPFLKIIEEFYLNFKDKVFIYLLIRGMIKNNLSIPILGDKDVDGGEGIRVENGILPILQKIKEEKKSKYVPLHFHFSLGSSVLFGANISGKTTLLKTLYFFLKLIKVGLPVPAEKLEVIFPQAIGIHLKNSGSLIKSNSSFSDELWFIGNSLKAKKGEEFSSLSSLNSNKEATYILIDELFQTTTPHSGVSLSKIVLDYVHGLKENIFFICTSHYPEIIDEKKIHLYLMNDKFEVIEVDKEKSDWWKKEEKSVPLKLALGFPLPEELKLKIKDLLLNN